MVFMGACVKCDKVAALHFIRYPPIRSMSLGFFHSPSPLKGEETGVLASPLKAKESRRGRDDLPPLQGVCRNVILRRSRRISMIDSVEIIRFFTSFRTPQFPHYDTVSSGGGTSPAPRRVQDKALNLIPPMAGFWGWGWGRWLIVANC